MKKNLAAPLVLAFLAITAGAFGASAVSPNDSLEQDPLGVDSQSPTEERLPATRASLLETVSLPDGFTIQRIRGVAGSDTLFFATDDGDLGDLTITGDPEVIGFDIDDIVGLAIELLKLATDRGGSGGGGGERVCVDQTVKVGDKVTVTTTVCTTPS